MRTAIDSDAKRHPYDTERIHLGVAGLLPDWMIRKYIPIHPFAEGEKRPGKISYGLTSAGYDLRLGEKFKLFHATHPNAIVDPKSISDDCFVDVYPSYDETGAWVLIPPNGYILGESLEVFTIPRDILVIVVGKSSLARCGIIVNVTPGEPEWCTSPDTEALTPSGWVPIPKIQSGDEILTRRLDGTASYEKVARKIEKDFTGKLLRFHNQVVDQLVTPDHRMFVWNPYQSAEASLIPASDMFGKWNYKFDRRVTRPKEAAQTLHIAGRDYNAGDFAEFYGCWLGDGSAWYGSDGGYHIKLAVVTKERKWLLYQSLLERLGVTNARALERGFHWYDKELCLWLMQHGHAKDKFVHPTLRDLGPELSRRVLLGLVSSDGNEQTQTITTSSRTLADDIQVLALNAGLLAIVREVQSTRWGKVGTAYKVRLTTRCKTPKMDPKTHSTQEYSGKVYCVTVPNGVWLSRRNGKPSWTGNCGKWTIEISNASPVPAKIYANEGVAQALFFKTLGECERSYADKGGRYQGQAGLTLPTVD